MNRSDDDAYGSTRYTCYSPNKTRLIKDNANQLRSRSGAYFYNLTDIYVIANNAVSLYQFGEISNINYPLRFR